MSVNQLASSRLTGATTASASVLQALLNSTATEQDVVLLEQLRDVLRPGCVNSTQTDDDCEREWLEKALDDNPFPSAQPSKLFGSQRELDQFTLYVFERRYGRTEFLINSTIDGNQENLDGLDDLVGSPRVQDDSRLLVRLNGLLDEHIRWFSSQPLNVELLASLKYAIVQAHSLPVVRNHTCVHAMEWIKIKSHSGFTEKVFLLVKALIVSGITDVWSAIRNSCVARLAPSLDHFTLDQAHVLYSELIQICQAKDSPWQAVEGSVMGMTTLVRRFSWTGIMKHQLNNNTKEEISEYMLKFGSLGSSEQSSLPKFIMDSVHSVLYSLLAHQQLSIRDQATNAFSSILSRCEFQEAFFAFQDVIQRLCKGIIDCPSSDGNAVPLPHVAVLRSDFKFLQPYQAEGLLGVCVFLIKHIPPGYLLTMWPLYFSTFNLYLMHPASTVRQITSAVFKYLVAKESSSPVLLKLVLQGLAADWQVDTDMLLCDLQSRVATSGEHTDSSYRTPTPEARHGVSPVQASVSQGSLVPTPPPPADSVVDHQGCSSQDRQSGTHPPLHKQQRISIRNVQKLFDERPSQTAGHVVSQSWEWREGRLLAYELILKFVIANHIHYVFPTFALSRSSASASASVDENLISKPARPRAWTAESVADINISNSQDGDAIKPLPKLRRQSDISSPNQNLKSNSFAAISSQMSSFTPMTIQEDESVYIEAASESCYNHQNPSQVRDAWSRHAKRSSSFSKIDDDASRTRKLIRQYSVTCQKYPKRPFRPPKPQGVLLANSLLCQASDLEIDTNNAIKAAIMVSGPVSSIVKTLASPLGKIEQQNSDFLMYKELSNKSSKPLEDLPQWAFQLELEPLTCILSQILFQTIECLADSRWELRRMSQQLLPLVTETIRWFNMAPLAYLWDNHLTRENTLLCYGGCISLKNSVMHAGRLRYYLDQPPSTWKDPESCSRVAMSIVNEIKKGIKKWLTKVRMIVQYPGYDRLTVVAMETIMLSHIYFYTSLDVSQKLEAEDQILDVLLSVFVCSFPHKPLSAALKAFCRGQTSEFLVPLDGFLSCSSRIETPEKNAQQFGKHFISEAHVTLKSFLKTCQVNKLVVIFPVLIHYIEWLSEETALCHSLVDGLQHILTKTQELINSSAQRQELDSLIQRYFDHALIAVCDAITSSKVLDIAILRQLLDLTLKACEFIDQPSLSHVFKAISEKLDYDPDLLRLVSIDNVSRTNTPDLYILNNDIPTSPVDEPAIPVEEEDEEPDKLGVLRESEALDASHGSGRGPVRQEDDESDMSDWDSWEEEEEDQSALIAVFADFLKNLQNMYENKTDQETSVFKKQLQKCERLERQAIASVMQS